MKTLIKGTIVIKPALYFKSFNCLGVVVRENIDCNYSLEFYFWLTASYGEKINFMLTL